MPPVQRKVSRIEQHMRPRSRGFASGDAAPARAGEFGMLPPKPAEPQAFERPLTARERTEIAEAQAYKAELVAIHDAIGRTAADMAALMRDIQQKVREAHGIELAPEVRFLGF